MLAVPRLCELYPDICLTAEKQKRNEQYSTQTNSNTQQCNVTEQHRTHNRENSPQQVSKPTVNLYKQF
jgi:hypothetical protein